ncbi:hypothetical protein K227x_29610 [Rubripirellula lacrimiformis]|uniref:Secreted protein n=1 Tax=Rubripirellula lacrimiformis TaxID=1930273 RepID=A0A517NBQ0_9BACT|nr:hypothetical protein [Rubripirellula lacrimiformis]QDT04569.1 hypothetical protein K227x_29610 [Rubripirellula lacrimiformis]
MSRLSVLLGASLFSLCVLAGCGGSAENTNIAENADQAAMDAYEAAVAQESAGMDSTPAAK